MFDLRRRKNPSLETPKLIRQRRNVSSENNPTSTYFIDSVSLGSPESSIGSPQAVSPLSFTSPSGKKGKYYVSYEDSKVSNLCFDQKEKKFDEIQSPDDPDSSSRTRFRWCLVFCILVYYYVFPFSENRAIEKEMANIDKKINELKLYKEDLLNEAKKTRYKVKTMHSRIQSIEADMNIKTKKYYEIISGIENEKLVKQNDGLDNMKAFNEKELELIHEMKKLQDHIKEIKYEETVEKYGEGPHVIEFTVLFSSADDVNESKKDTFLVQLVPISVMPVSVSYFLDMAHSNLWDGASLLHHREHESHVIKGMTIDFRTAKSRRHMFDRASLSHLPFQEYSDHAFCDHSQYTLGFSGRPAGPDFYINLNDNVHLHGQNSQGHRVLSEEGDPCFGILLPGHSRDVIDRIRNSFDPANDEHNTSVAKKKTIHVVGILSAKLL